MNISIDEELILEEVDSEIVPDELLVEVTPDEFELESITDQISSRSSPVVTYSRAYRPPCWNIRVRRIGPWKYQIELRPPHYWRATVNREPMLFPANRIFGSMRTAMREAEKIASTMGRLRRWISVPDERETWEAQIRIGWR